MVEQEIHCKLCNDNQIVLLEQNQGAFTRRLEKNVLPDQTPQFCIGICTASLNLTYQVWVLIRFFGIRDNSWESTKKIHSPMKFGIGKSSDSFGNI